LFHFFLYLIRLKKLEQIAASRYKDPEVKNEFIQMRLLTLQQTAENM